MLSERPQVRLVFLRCEADGARRCGKEGTGGDREVPRKGTGASASRWGGGGGSGLISPPVTSVGTREATGEGILEKKKKTANVVPSPNVPRRRAGKKKKKKVGLQVQTLCRVRQRQDGLARVGAEAAFERARRGVLARLASFWIVSETQTWIFRGRF